MFCLIKECDLGNQSILHAVKTQPSPRRNNNLDSQSRNAGSKPLNETLIDLQLSGVERQKAITEEGKSTYTVCIQLSTVT